ncbi:MAG: pitrilysin family protein [Nitrospiraceae bacterium]|nr:pitrilysin family protein [Nitrospiraceae bacterium]
MFRKELLENGITVVMERMTAVRSFTAGIWIKVGSRAEPVSKNGISHFLEHMFFKGTAKRSAREIALEIDNIGGDLNAFTSKENTAFYVKVLDLHMEKGLDVLADIFCHSSLLAEEVEKERGVIKEEIKMVEDTPDDLVHDLFSTDIWGKEGIGRPVLGTRQSVNGIGRDDLVNHVRRFYGTKDTIVACAGSFEPEKLLEILNSKLGHLRRGSEPEPVPLPPFCKGVNIHKKRLSEAHICLGLQGLPQAHPKRYEYYILNTILGAGISSRLFQEVREKRGLAYTIYSFISSYADTGVFGVYAGTGKKKCEEVVSLALEILSRLPETLEQPELDKAKEQLKGNLILGLESTSTLMQNLAKQEIYFKRHFTPAEIIAEIDAVTLPRLRTTAELVIKGKSPVLTVLGPVEGQPFGEVLPPL